MPYRCLRMQYCTMAENQITECCAAHWSRVMGQFQICDYKSKHSQSIFETSLLPASTLRKKASSCKYATYRIASQTMMPSKMKNSWANATSFLREIGNQVLEESTDTLRTPEQLNRRIVESPLPKFLFEIEHSFLMNGATVWTITAERDYLLGLLFRHKTLRIMISEDGSTEASPLYATIETRRRREHRRNWLYDE